MARRGADAFESLISSVPGVDTSGFVKRSMNELKAASKAPGRGVGRTNRAPETRRDPAQGRASPALPPDDMIGGGDRSRRSGESGRADGGEGGNAEHREGPKMDQGLGEGGFGQSPSPVPPATRQVAGGAPRRGGGESALDDLMANVPGVDTSGFVKRSMNELREGGGRGGGGEGRGRGVGQGPDGLPTAGGTGKDAKAPSQGLDDLGDAAHDFVSSGGPTGLWKAEEDIPLGDSWGGSRPSAGAPIVGVSADELDALGAPPVPAGPAAGAAGLQDLFGGIPGGLPAQPARPASQAVGVARGDDLLGIGSQDISNLEALHIGEGVGRPGGPQGDNYGKIDERGPAFAGAEGGIKACEGRVLGTDSVSVSHRGEEEGPGELSQRSTEGGPATRQHKASKDLFVPVSTNPNLSDEEWATASEEGSPSPNPLGGIAGYDGWRLRDGGGMGSMGQQSAVAKESEEVVRGSEEVPKRKKSKAPTLGRLSRGVAKELKKGLGKLQKPRGSDAPGSMEKSAVSKDKQPKDTQPKDKGQKEGKEGKGGFKSMQIKAMKYKQNLGKAAVQWSHKGLEAVKQGLEVAHDWMDKSIEARRKSSEGQTIETHVMDLGDSTDLDSVGHQAQGANQAVNEDRGGQTASQVADQAEEDDYADIVELAAELQNLPQEDRAFAVSEMEPEIQVKVVELLRSQGVDIMQQPATGLDGGECIRSSGMPSPPPTAFSQPPVIGVQRVVSDNALPALRDEQGLREIRLPEKGPDANGLGSAGCIERSASVPEFREVDLLNVNTHNGASRPVAEDAAASVAVEAPCTTDPEELGSFFQSPSTTKLPVPQSDGVDDIFNTESNRAGGVSVVGQPQGPADVLMGFDGSESESRSRVAAAAARHSNLYTHSGGGEGEPEIRRALRQQREEQKHAKMAEALDNKIQRDKEEVERREAQHGYKEAYLPKIQAWKDQHRANIRGMLTSLHTMLWEGTSWKPLTVADVLDPGQVKRAYMKANLIVHPDKVRQKKGTDEQVVIADMVFDALKEAWNEFQKK